MGTAQRPQDLVFTLFGDYLLHRDVPVWVGSLIALLEPFSLSEAAVRTVLSRMSQKGWLRAERVGRHSFYDLASRGRSLLEEGEARIYHPDWDRPWDGSWFLLAYSVPEDERHLRTRLRDRLAWLGFGSLGNGLWISPHDVEAEVREVADELEVQDYVSCFRAEGAAFATPADLVEKCWNLGEINSRYEEFIGRHVPDFHRCRAASERGDVSDAEFYVRRFRLVHEYRDFPLVDPYLPRELLPPTWGGECAAHLFRTYHDLLSSPANRYVEAVLASEPAASRNPASGRT